MHVADVMETDVVTVAPSDTLADAARALRANQASAVVVVDALGKPAGILTERDVVQSVVDGADPSTTLVSERMTKDPRTLTPGAPADQAQDLMIKNGFRHVPVVDAGKLVGMVAVPTPIKADRQARRPVTDFGTAGTISSFRGPFADGPPAEALEVVTPALEKTGIAEIRRLVVIYVVIFVSVMKGLALRALGRRKGRTWVQAGYDGAVDAFIALGPTFVKLGQVIASSAGMFPADLSAACRRCLDEVPPFPSEHVRKMIQEDLGRAPSQVFKSFDDVPLSAASIGQVHACTLRDGREAVIKLQRPGIRKSMTTDLRIMYKLAVLFEKTKWGKTANATAMIKDLHAVTFQELNPAVEAWRQDRFRAKIWEFGDNTMITAPEIYWEYCGPRMICMERVSGIPMDDFEGMRQRGIDGQLILRRGAKVWAEAVMIHGPFHGDMHAGNIWALDDGRGCYLDFGIMGELTEEWKQLVKDLFYTCVFDLDFTRVARAYRKVGIFPEGMGTDEELGAQLGMILGPMLTGGFGQLNLSDLITQSVELMKQYNATGAQELVLIAKQLLYIERYTKGLAPDYVITADPFIMKNIFPEEAAKKAAELGVEFPA